MGYDDFDDWFHDVWHIHSDEESVFHDVAWASFDKYPGKADDTIAPEGTFNWLKDLCKEWEGTDNDEVDYCKDFKKENKPKDFDEMNIDEFTLASTPLIIEFAIVKGWYVM